MVARIYNESRYVINLLIPVIANKVFIKMKKRYLKLILLITSFLIIWGCNAKKEDIKESTKQNMAFPVEYVIPKDSELFFSKYYDNKEYSINPKTIELKNDSVFLFKDKKVFKIKLNQDNPELDFIIQNENPELINANQKGFITVDGFGNIYIENIKLFEKEMKNKSGKKYTKLVKEHHKILKFDYEGNFLYSLGVSGKYDKSSFSDDISIYEMSADNKGSLFVITGSFQNITSDDDLDSPVFKKENIEKINYNFIKYNNKGELSYTLKISKIDELYTKTENSIKIIEDVKISAEENMLYIALKDYHKKNTSEKDYYIEQENFSIYKYDLNTNDLLENPIKLKDPLYRFYGVSSDGNLFFVRPEDNYELRFIVVDNEGDIIENKKILINNIRQNRYDFFFIEEGGFIVSAFREKDRIRVIKYR